MACASLLSCRSRLSRPTFSSRRCCPRVSRRTRKARHATIDETVYFFSTRKSPNKHVLAYLPLALRLFTGKYANAYDVRTVSGPSALREERRRSAVVGQHKGNEGRRRWSRQIFGDCGLLMQEILIGVGGVRETTIVSCLNFWQGGGICC